MQENGKDTVYIDVDDEITTIIDKMTGSKQKIVALVLPKRASVLQSVVNMKLLKRSADNANKNVVLVTTEAALMPLAGAAGLHVAKTPTSKPEIPVNPIIRDSQLPFDDDSESLSLDDEPEPEYTAENAGSKPIGDLAKKSSPAVALGTAPDAIETVELEDETPAAAEGPVKGGKKQKKAKEPKIPNFSKFQKQLALGLLLLIVLITGLVVAMKVLPKAAIAIATDATDYNSNVALTLDTGASDVSVEENTVPATLAQQQKTYTEEVDATGEENNGEKATGSMTMTSTRCAPNIGAPKDVPAGTGVSTGGNTYITQNDAAFSYNGNDGGQCIYYKSGAVGITAQKAGTAFNKDNATFSVSGRSELSGTGSASGGTDDIVQVVSQADIDKAKKKINAEDATTIKDALAQQLRGNNLYPVEATFTPGDPNTSTSANAGDKAKTVTVTQSITYTMYGAKRDDLDKLIQNDIKQQIDTNTQTILSDGLDSADIKLTRSTDTTAEVGMQTTATVGPKLDLENLKEQIRGKKAGYVKSLIGNQPGVTNVTVKLSPFWVSSVPTNAEKITITVDKAAQGNDGS